MKFSDKNIKPIYDQELYKDHLDNPLKFGDKILHIDPYGYLCKTYFISTSLTGTTPYRFYYRAVTKNKNVPDIYTCYHGVIIKYDWKETEKESLMTEAFTDFKTLYKDWCDQSKYTTFESYMKACK